MKILNERSQNVEIVLPDEQNFSQPASEEADHPDDQAAQDQKDLESGQDQNYFDDVNLFAQAQAPGDQDQVLSH